MFLESGSLYLSAKTTPKGNEMSFSLTTPEEINTYAFLTLRKAVEFRIKTGGSMLRGREAEMARNYGWSTRKRFSPALLDDLNAALSSLDN